MRQIFSGIGTAVLLAAAAHAAAVCPSPQELRALRAAVLQQQLAAAAQSCHAAVDYGRFVEVYRGAIVASDKDVRRFFQRQNAGESYDAYKSRIARDISLKSLHDARFCAAAKAVFDLALGRSQRRAPSALVQTGYERCRPVPDRPVLAAIPAGQARPVKASVPIPTPAPLGPRALAAIAAIHTPVASPPPKPTRLAAVAPVQAARPAAPIMAAPSVDEPVSREAQNDERDDWDNVPNAYQPGSRWVGAEVADPPPWRWQESQPSNLYRGPDGRWYVRIPRHERWSYGD